MARRFPYFVAAFMALAAPATSSSASADGSHKAYGASGLLTTDNEKLSASIVQGLKDAGLKAPKVDMFPSDPAAREGANSENDGILGIALNGDTFRDIDERLGKGLYHLEAACPTSPPEWRRKYQVFAAIHESVHEVARQIGTNQSVLKAQQGKQTGAVPDVFIPQIAERIADAGAALYVLSNYGGAKENLAFLASIEDLRKAALDVGHDSTSSLQAAIDAFRKNPKTNLSIVDVTRWAAHIISQQPALAGNVEIAADANFHIKTGVTVDQDKATNILFDSEKEFPLRKEMAQMNDARNRLCRTLGDPKVE